MIALLLIIRFGERLPFRSVGFGRATLLQSLGWGVVLTMSLHAFGGHCHCPDTLYRRLMGAALAELPVWLVTLIVVRAGVLEELFYRGYAIERLQALGLNRYWAGTIPL